MLKCLLAMVGLTVGLASVVPICQFLYDRFVNGKTLKLTYYFSSEIYDQHLRDSMPCHMCRVITKEALDEAIKKEDKRALP